MRIRSIKSLLQIMQVASLSVAVFYTSLSQAEGNISGIVKGENGPEAGVWVIAETNDLKTTYRKIVVTNDDGKFLIPDLPEANYELWARGYGLADSNKQKSRPGKKKATIRIRDAATPQEAAEVYPANFWYSLLEVPTDKHFPGSGSDGNGINEQMRNQALFVDRLKDGCQLCHQMGNKATRELSLPMQDAFDSTRDAWEQRVKLGGGAMDRPMKSLGDVHALDMFSDWTDRIMAGEVPRQPPRPDGVEQNLVLTQWGWSNDLGFVHDNVSTDKREPTLRPNGQEIGVAQTK